MYTLASFILWRIAGFVVSAAAPRFIPYLGFFPYKELFADYGLPSFINAFANFDGAQYLILVREGYNTYTQAYFPLYFLLVRAVSFLFLTPHGVRPRNELLSALFVSNVSFFAGLLFFRKYLTLVYEKNKGAVAWSTALLLLYPTSFFFGAVYTEGLFFLLFTGFLLALKRRNLWVAGLCAALASATRLMGIFFFIPFVFRLLENKTGGKKGSVWRFLFALAPFAGFAAYAAYLWVSVGDPLFFFHAQPAFGANRSTNIILLPQVYYRYLKIFITAAPNFQYFVSAVEFVFFNFTVIILALDLLRLMRAKHLNYERVGLNIFSFANILLPTVTGTLSSIPRYALFSVSVFLFLSEIKNPFAKTAVALVFALLQIVLLGFFVQGYFIG